MGFQSTQDFDTAADLAAQVGRFVDADAAGRIILHTTAGTRGLGPLEAVFQLGGAQVGRVVRDRIAVVRVDYAALLGDRLAIAADGRATIPGPGDAVVAVAEADAAGGQVLVTLLGGAPTSGAVVPPATNEVVMDPNGDDANSGSAARPVRTYAAALRLLVGQSDAGVLVNPGTYAPVVGNPVTGAGVFVTPSTLGSSTSPFVVRSPLVVATSGMTTVAAPGDMTLTTNLPVLGEDAYRPFILRYTSGPLVGVTRKVGRSTGAVLTIANPTGTAIPNGTTFELLAPGAFWPVTNVQYQSDGSRTVFDGIGFQPSGVFRWFGRFELNNSDVSGQVGGVEFTPRFGAVVAFQTNFTGLVGGAPMLVGAANGLSPANVLADSCTMTDATAIALGTSTMGLEFTDVKRTQVRAGVGGHVNMFASVSRAANGTAVDIAGGTAFLNAVALDGFGAVTPAGACGVVVRGQAGAAMILVSGIGAAGTDVGCRLDLGAIESELAFGGVPTCTVAGAAGQVRVGVAGVFTHAAVVAGAGIADVAAPFCQARALIISLP